MRVAVRVLLVVDGSGDVPWLTSAIESDGDLTVVDALRTSGDVRAGVRRVAPDVVAIDVSSPSGLRAVEEIMGFDPHPVLALSGPEGERSSGGVEALVAGAADALPLPGPGDAAAAGVLRVRLRALRGVHVVRHPRARLSASRRPPDLLPVVAVAASTGGPAALATVLSGLRSIDAPVLVVQHLHRDFVEGFVDWLGRESGLAVSLARDGQELAPRHVLVGPADVHLALAPGRRVSLQAEPETLHRPSADVLFRSVASVAGSKGIGVLLTGMGGDGAEGLLELRRRGALTIAQDEATSAVFGMPAVAIAKGAATQVLGLGEIGPAVARAVAGRAR